MVNQAKLVYINKKMTKHLDQQKEKIIIKNCIITNMKKMHKVKYLNLEKIFQAINIQMLKNQEVMVNLEMFNIKIQD